MRFLVAYDPNSNEWGNYARWMMQVEYLTTAPIPVIYKWSAVPPSPGRGRLIVMDASDQWVPVSGWVACVGDSYTFNAVAIGNMSSAWWLELEGGTPADTFIQSYPFVRNTTNAPLGQNPVYALRRIEVEKHSARGVPYRVTPPPVGWRPYVGKVKPRPVVPGKLPTTRLAENQLWCSTLWGADGNWSMRTDFQFGGKGDLHATKFQKYDYSGATQFGGATHKAGKDKPLVLCRTGTRTSTFQGHVAQVIIRDNLSGIIGLETDSRCWFMQFAGIEIPPGVTDLRGMHPGQGNSDLLWGWEFDPDTRAWSYLGDFRYVPGVTFVNEPWQISIARLMPDGSINRRSGFTLWVCDPITGDLFAVDIYPRHPQLPQAIPTTFMPAGYVRPADAAQSVFVRLSANPPGSWGNCLADDQKIYYTNIEAQTITRVHHSGSDKEVILTGKKTLAELGYSTAPDMRLHPSSKTIAELRSYIVDGQLATASCIRPQFMHYDEHGVPGTILFAEIGTFVVRRLDPVAGTITTFSPIPEQNLSGTQPAQWTRPDGVVVDTVRMLGGASSSGTQDPTFWIDDGTIGAAGDVKMQAWGTTHVWNKTGGYLGPLAPVTVRSLSNGRADLCKHPTYAWGGDTRGGIEIRWGNDGYSQCKVYTPLAPTDYVPSTAEQAAIISGDYIWRRIHYSKRGVDGYGVHGFPNVEEMGSWDDAHITADLIAEGGLVSEATDFIKWVRYRTIEIDYSPTPPQPVVRTFTLTATNAAGSVSATASVVVASP